MDTLDPSIYEQTYVHDVYNAICDDFNVTRVRVWNELKQFIDNLNDDLKIAEIGSGNGKNLKYINENKKTDELLGVEICDNFIDICKKNIPNIKIIKGDNLNIPISDNYFDVVLSIAVIHHFSTENRRLQALNELLRIVKPNGTVFIQVWSIDQKDRYFDTQDNLISWKYTKINREYKRYYHLFQNNELENLLKKIDNCVIIKSFFDKGNYGAIITKSSA